MGKECRERKRGLGGWDEKTKGARQLLGGRGNLIPAKKTADETFSRGIIFLSGRLEDARGLWPDMLQPNVHVLATN